MTLETYIKKVDAEIARLTHNVCDLDMMVDYADEELSLSELHTGDVTVHRAAVALLENAGFYRERW